MDSHGLPVELIEGSRYSSHGVLRKHALPRKLAPLNGRSGSLRALARTFS